MTRAEKSGIYLNKDDAAIVKGMLKRGDRQHDSASWFGVNGGRIAEISTGEKFSNITIKEDGLPPPGPYLSGRATASAFSDLKKIREDVKKVFYELETVKSKGDIKASRIALKRIYEQLSDALKNVT